MWTNNRKTQERSSTEILEQNCSDAIRFPGQILNYLSALWFFGVGAVSIFKLVESLPRGAFFFHECPLGGGWREVTQNKCYHRTPSYIREHSAGHAAFAGESDATKGWKLPTRINSCWSEYVLSNQQMYAGQISAGSGVMQYRHCRLIEFRDS